MELKELKNHWEEIRDEYKKLPMNCFIMDEPRPEGEWVGSAILEEIISKYSSGRCGWLKGGQQHVADGWISFPLIWRGRPLLGNCNICPKTSEMLSQIEGVHVAGFSLMKPGVKLFKHTDHVSDGYKFTYHLGLDCVPDSSFLHHSVLGTIDERNGKHIVMNAKEEHWAENTSDKDRVILYMEIYE
jgi:aspartyl/asparaginyl beta-hydroxylase (cupin superfamily)